MSGKDCDRQRLKVSDLFEESGVRCSYFLDEFEVPCALDSLLVGDAIESGREGGLTMLVFRVRGGAYDTMK